MHNYNRQFLQFYVSVILCVTCFIRVDLSVKVKLSVSLLCVCAILPAKATPEMTCTVSGGTLNPTHSLCGPYGLEDFAFMFSYVIHTQRGQ